MGKLMNSLYFLAIVCVHEVKYDTQEGIKRKVYLDGLNFQEVLGVFLEVEGNASTTAKGVSVGVLNDGERSISFGSPDVSVNQLSEWTSSKK
jgi:hypothetical protein